MILSELQTVILNEIMAREPYFDPTGLELFNLIPAPGGLTVHLCGPRHGSITYALKMSREDRDAILTAWLNVQLEMVPRKQVTLEDIRQFHLNLLHRAGMPAELDDQVTVEKNPDGPGRVILSYPKIWQLDIG